MNDERQKDKDPQAQAGGDDSGEMDVISQVFDDKQPLVSSADFDQDLFGAPAPAEPAQPKEEAPASAPEAEAVDALELSVSGEVRPGLESGASREPAEPDPGTPEQPIPLEPAADEPSTV